jgi:hypothetical protein
MNMALANASRSGAMTWLLDAVVASVVYPMLAFHLLLIVVDFATTGYFCRYSAAPSTAPATPRPTIVDV